MGSKVDPMIYNQDLYTVSNIEENTERSPNNLGCNGDGSDPYVHAFIGQNLRFDPVIQRLEERLEQYYETIGPSIYLQNDQEVAKLIEQEDYGTIDNPYICFGISAGNESEFHYKIHMPLYTDSEDGVPNTADQVYDDFTRVPDIESFRKYGNSAYTWFMNEITAIVAELEAGFDIENQEIRVSYFPFKTEEYNDDNFVNIMLFFFPYIILFIYIPLIFVVTFGIVDEKASRAREGMRMMGLTDGSYWMSWWIFTNGVNFVISLESSLLLAFGITKNTQWHIWFIYLMLYGNALFGFSIFMTSLFSKPRNAVSVGIILYFLSYYLSFFFEDNNYVGVYPRLLISLIPTVGMKFGQTVIWIFETQTFSLTFEQLGMMFEYTTMGYIWLSLTVSFILFFFLGLYFDSVLPSQFGIKKHPCYCFNLKRKQKRIYKAKVQQRRQEMSGTKERLINFSDTQSIENQITQNFEYVGEECTKLEQENKIIDIQHLRKVYQNGKVAVQDVSLKLYEGQIFALLGHNGAGKTSTISMLTGLFEASSGSIDMYGKDIIIEQDQIKTFLGVCPQHDVLFPQLTIREHLEIFCAFKGVSKEEVEKEVTKMIKDLDLEECGDNYSINLSGGQKRRLCIGIAMIGGSKVVVLDEPTSGMDLSARRKVWDMLKTYKENRIIILTTHFMDEADILGDRIGIMAGGKVVCCGSSLFLKNRFGVGYNLVIVKQEREISDQIDQFMKLHLPGASKVSDVSSEVSYQIPKEEADKFNEFFKLLDDNIQDLGIKSYGVGITTLEEVFLRVGRGDLRLNEEDNVVNIRDEIKEEIKRQESSRHDSIFKNDFCITTDSETNQYTLFWMHFKAMIVKRFLTSFRNSRTLIIEVFFPILLLLLGIAVQQSPFRDPIDIIWGSNQLHNPIQLTVAPATPETEQFLMYRFQDENEFANQIIDLQEEGTLEQIMIEQAEYLYDNKLGKIRYGAYYVNEFNDDLQHISIQCNTTSIHIAPVFGSMAYNSILKKISGDANMEITFSSSPLPYRRGTVERVNTLYASIIGFLLAIAYALVMANIVVGIVQERQSNVRHQQIVSGANLIAYWASFYIVDLIKGIPPTLAAIVFIEAFGADIPYAWVLLLVQLFSLLPFTYLLSFFFKTENAAMMVIRLINIVVAGFGSFVIVFLMSVDELQDIAATLKWILMFIPSYAFSVGVALINFQPLYPDLFPGGPLSWSCALPSIVFLLGTTPLYWFLIYLVESGKFQKKSKALTEYKDDIDPLIKFDEDVADEEQRINSETTSKEQYEIKVKNLRKVFQVNGFTKVAIRNVSFGLSNGECFALLGVNGAGKSTTFKSLTGDIQPTKGSVEIQGLNLADPNQFSNARKLIGYCPQIDCIFEGMTVKEHLQFYASIKGIPYRLQEQIIEEQIITLDLNDFRNVRAELLSGGNKRKLSVAMAMIGNPPIVLLDEPSTGMDPKSKRFMWSVISQISTQRKKSVVVLTTHSMEEAEALCTKMGIMVNGYFKCMGPCQYLKGKFGTGYEIEVKFSYPDSLEVSRLVNKCPNETHVYQDNINDILFLIEKEEIAREIILKGLGNEIAVDLQTQGEIQLEDFIKRLLLVEKAIQFRNYLAQYFDSIDLVEAYSNFYRLEMERSNKSIGFLFSTIESCRKDYLIEEYAVAQTSLEQIFNNFAKQQDVEQAFLEDQFKQSVISRRSTVRKSTMRKRQLTQKSTRNLVGAVKKSDIGEYMPPTPSPPSRSALSPTDD